MSKRKQKRARRSPASRNRRAGRHTASDVRPPFRRITKDLARQISRAAISGRGAGDNLRHAIPLAALLCSVIAILNAFCWSIITPPFAVPDEPFHFAYVKQLAEAHALPSSSALEFSPEEERALIDLHEFPHAVLPPIGAISSRAEQGRLAHDLTVAASAPREGSKTAGVATSQPPLYYAIETVPYLLGSAGTLLTRLELMRLLSALLAGVTTLFVFLFAREALPAARTAWLTAGLSVAFAPLLGFMSGAVNPDSLLFAVSAALFWAFARTFRRGLTYRRAIMIGAIIAVGLLTKLNFVGLFPGAVVGLAVLGWRQARSFRVTDYGAVGLGVGIAVIPIIPYTISNLAGGKPAFGLVSTAVTVAQKHSFGAGASYIWQLFLPRLPGMTSHFPGVFTTREIWFDGFVGLYGWSETAFSHWVYDVAAIIGVLVVVACGRAFVLARSTARRRLGELLVYTIMAAGLLILIGGASYIHSYTNPSEESYAEARYLLPLLALIGAAVGLATRAAGRRWEAVIGSLIVFAMVADSVFSQLLVIARFYG